VFRFQKFCKNWYFRRFRRWQQAIFGDFNECTAPFHNIYSRTHGLVQRKCRSKFLHYITWPSWLARRWWWWWWSATDKGWKENSTDTPPRHAGKSRLVLTHISRQLLLWIDRYGAGCQKSKRDFAPSRPAPLRSLPQFHFCSWFLIFIFVSFLIPHFYFASFFF
jgi:hypothetical protein